jgi:hypothetical protein
MAKPLIRIEKSKEWKQAQDILNKATNLIREAVDIIPRREAEFFKDQIKDGIMTQAPGGKHLKPISPATKLARRALGISGDKALISRGELMNSISLRRDGKSWFVGIPKKRKGRTTLAQAAQIQEEGYGPVAIKMTPQMRKFLFGVVFKNSPNKGNNAEGGDSFLIIKVPPRPFIKPVFDKYGSKDQALPRLNTLYAQTLKGMFGK